MCEMLDNVCTHEYMSIDKYICENFLMPHVYIWLWPRVWLCLWASQRELRQVRRKAYSSINEGTQKIGFTGDGVEVSQLNNLSFKPPGLQW